MRFFFEESLELKSHYIKLYEAVVLVMGDDWKGEFDYFNEYCKVVYFERTPKISTTQIKAEIFHQQNINNNDVNIIIIHLEYRMILKEFS